MRRICALILISAMAVICRPAMAKFAYTGTVKPGSWLAEQIVHSYNGQEDTVKVQIYFPKGYVNGKSWRTLIVLHEYRGSQRSWETNTDIAAQAERHSMVIVCPYMKNSVYESQYFPETETKWAPMPGGLFIPTVLVPWLRNSFNLAVDARHTAIMGNSTGARGALLAAARNPEMYGAVAGLSGDYDPLSMPRSRILASIYGPYRNFKDRWKQVDNVKEMAAGLQSVPVYLMHGNKDFVVPKEQSLILAMEMRKLAKQSVGGGFDVTYREVPYAQHEWGFWRKALPEVMGFMDKNLKESDK